MIGGDTVKQNVTTDAVRPAFLFFAGFLAVGAVIYLAAKETRGRALEDI